MDNNLDKKVKTDSENKTDVDIYENNEATPAENNNAVESLTDSSAEENINEIVPTADDDEKPADGASETLDEQNTGETVPTSDDNDNTSESSSAENKKVTIVEIFNKVKNFFAKFNYMDIAVRLVAAYFLGCSNDVWKIEPKFFTLDFPKKVDPILSLLTVLGIFIVLTGLNLIIKRIKKAARPDGFYLAISLLFYLLSTVYRNNNFYYSFGVSIMFAVCVAFLMHNGYFDIFKKLSTNLLKVIVVVSALCFAFFVSSMTIYRYLTYNSSCFDFGIFAQMYYYMVNHLTLETTCERNELLSHFAIHFSPIYYLLLPIFYVFQMPQTLLICQALLVASGIIPLYLICRNFKLSNCVTLAMCITYVFMPALIMPNFYDFHENAFLTPLIMWLLWSIEKGKIPFMYIFMALTLFIKEDAFIYVVCIALFVIFSKKKRYDKKHEKEKSLLLHGMFMTGISLGYFFTVSTLMQKYGSGVMEYRYTNIMMDPDKGMINVIETILLDPAFAFSEAFKEEKLLFFLQIMVPLLFLPFISKKFSHMFLLIPLFLINLISGWQYQYDIGFQYVYGVIAILIYLSALNLHEMECTPKKYFASSCMCISIILGFMYSSDKIYYYELYKNNETKYSYMNDAIEKIPEDASVQATTFLIPQLSQREVLYQQDPKEMIGFNDVDFVAFNGGYTQEELASFQTALADKGYEFYFGYNDWVYIYISSSYLSEHPELSTIRLTSPMYVD